MGPVPGEIPGSRLHLLERSERDRGTVSRADQLSREHRGRYLGLDGVFAAGRRISLAEIEKQEGTSYTAAFSERLVGDSIDGQFAAWNYAAAAGPLPAEGCSLMWLKDQGAHWRGDAGSSWVSAGYRTTLYNHALQPGSSLSCAALDGQSAFMGASSGHNRGVNLLMLDGSVKIVLPSIDSKIWRGFAAVGDPVPHPNQL